MLAGAVTFYLGSLFGFFADIMLIFSLIKVAKVMLKYQSDDQLVDITDDNTITDYES